MTEPTGTQPEYTPELPPQKNNLNKILIAVTAGVAIVAFGLGYLSSSIPKNRQIDACQEVLTSIDDALTYDASFSSSDEDALAKCDSSYK